MLIVSNQVANRLESMGLKVGKLGYLEDRLQLLLEELHVDCLFRYKPTHKPYFCITRQLKDKQYALWEEEIFKPFIAYASDGEILDKRTKKTYYNTKFRTHRTNTFLPYYEKWYPLSFKIVPKDLTLTPLIIAVWFADDGSISFNSGFRLKLSSHGFCENDVEFLKEMLCDRYNEKFTKCKSENKFIIQSSDKGTRAFIKEIDVCLPPIDRKARWRNEFNKNITRFSQNVSFAI